MIDCLGLMYVCEVEMCVTLNGREWKKGTTTAEKREMRKNEKMKEKRKENCFKQQ